MFLLQLSIFAVAAFTPGFALVRRFRWSPMEKLCGSIGFSMVLLYLVAWGTFCWSPREQAGDIAWLALQIATGAASVALASVPAAISPGFCESRSSPGTGRLWLSPVVGAGGPGNDPPLFRPGWGADWLGHFHRSLFILHRFPPHSPLLGDDSFPARPPMMNAIVAFAMTPWAGQFRVFPGDQHGPEPPAVSSVLDDDSGLWTDAQGTPFPLLAVFAFNPVIIENATYSWTKSFACFFVILSLWFYLAALRKRDSGRMIAAFVFAAPGCCATTWAVLTWYSWRRTM